MGKIKKLPKHLISKIAAGEVVSSPANVVKELIENSIDAGATDIQIKLKNGGLKEITVIDNGEGMDEDDLLLCWSEHATSKLLEESDLEKISTLGFRGEALHSICSVGGVEIKSKVADELSGNYVGLKNGRPAGSGSVGMPGGTSVTVTDIFQKIPARLKFLKDTEKELKAVKDVVIGLAISHPGIRFRLYHDGNLIYDFIASEIVEHRLMDIFGRDFDKEYIKVADAKDHFVLEGYTALPSFSRKSNSRPYLYVNNRLVSNALVQAAVKKAYEELIDDKKTPHFILFLKTPLDYVDINVHPKKEQVNFLNDASIFDFVSESVKTALQSRDLTFVKEGFSVASDYMSTYLGELKDEFRNLKYTAQNILQVHDLYLISKSEKGVLIVDQHAAHERVIYEKLLDLYDEKNKESVGLLEPIILELAVGDAEVLSDNLEVLKNIGFDIQRHEKQKFTVSSAPALLENRNIKVIILELLDDLTSLGNGELLDSRGVLALSYLACRAAIKSGDKLSAQEATNLLRELEKTKTEYVCPHGRPAKVEIPLREIEKLFKR